MRRPDSIDHVGGSVVDDLVGAEAAHVIELVMARDTDHDRTGGFGHLGREAANAAGGTEDHHHVALLQADRLDALQSRNAGERKSRAELEVDGIRAPGDGARACNRVLGQRSVSELHLAGLSKYMVADL